VVLSNQGGRSVFGNAGRTERRGLELAYADAWSRRWHLAATYTWLDARYVDDVGACAGPPCAPGSVLIARGRAIPGLARNFAWVELRFSPVADLDLLLEGRFVDRVFANDANSAAAPAYASFDFALERRFRLGGLDGRGFARLNNLLDRAIVGSVIVNDSNGRYFEPAPGRNWLLGLSLGKSFD
jgi:iron complex outermembrane receptor protein